MSLLAPPATPPAPTAPHTRVQHIFYTAPYIKHLFDDFLETHPASGVMETDDMVNMLSVIYLFGLKSSTSFWKTTSKEAVIQERGALLAELELLRMKRGKREGMRELNHFQSYFGTLTGYQLPSRKARRGIDSECREADAMIRTILAVLAMKLYSSLITAREEEPSRKTDL